MNDNQNDINRLINALNFQKDKDRKYYLKIEIAKATDRSVKSALQDILSDIEKKERRNRIITVVVLILIILIAFYIIGVRKDTRNIELSEEITSSNNILQVEGNSSEYVEKKSIKEKNLSVDEVKQWVTAVWDKKYPNDAAMKNIHLNVDTDISDDLVYISVTQPQSGILGIFRINANGELEEADRFLSNANSGDWIVVSSNYMDISTVLPVNNNNAVGVKKIDTKDLSSEEAITWVKNYRLQEEGVTDEGDHEFTTELRQDGLLEITVIGWNPIKSFRKRSAIYRINENGYLEKGSPDSLSNWYIVSTEYIY